MVRRGAVSLALAVAVAVTLVLPGAAHGFSPPTNPGKPPVTTGHTGSNGGPQQSTDRGCSLYATSSSFGLSCIVGDQTDVQTVKEILAGDDVPTCWDELISPQDLATKYEYTEVPDSPYYLHTCITGIDVNESLYDQTKVQLNQEVIEIPITAKPCPKPYTDAEAGTCVMTLTRRQTIVVTSVKSLGAQIPDITIVTEPSTKVRTNEEVAYVDATANDDGTRLRRTPNYAVGGVTMWAQMDSYEIYPYGPDGGTRIACDGLAQVRPTDTPTTVPTACWWKYPQSSQGQPNQTYPFRAEADWTVYYADGTGTHTLAQFQKFDDLQLPVDDVQTLVIN